MQEKPNEANDACVEATAKDDAQAANAATTGTKEQEQEPVADASIAGEDTPTETPKKTDVSDNASAHQTSESGGMTSYIPSFGFGTSSRSSKESVPGWTPSTSDDPGMRESGDDKTADEAEGGAEKSVEDDSPHEDESKTPREKASSYGSYIPSFGLSSFSTGKSKDATKSKGKALEEEGDNGDAKEATEGKDKVTEGHEDDVESKVAGEDEENPPEEDRDAGEAKDETKKEKEKKPEVEKKDVNTAGLEDPFVD